MRALRAAGRAAARQDGAEVAGAEAHQRVVRVQRGHHHLADLAVGHRLAGARAHDLDDHAFVEHQALARRGLVGDQAQVGGAVALVGLDAACAQQVAQRGGEGLAADRGLAQRGQRHAALVGLFQRDAQEAGRAGIGIGTQLGHRLQLQLGVAHAAGKDRAADGVRAAFHHRAGRRQVVAEAVVHQVAGAKAGGEQRAAEAPVVGAGAFGFVDRAGRLEHAPRRARRALRAPADGGEAAEGVAGAAGLLALEQFVLARHRQLRQRAARADGGGIDAAQDLGKGGRSPAPRRSAPAARASARLRARPGRVFPARRSLQSSRSPHCSNAFFRSALKSRTAALLASVRACHCGLARLGRLTMAAASCAPSTRTRAIASAAPLEHAFALGQAQLAQFALQALQRLVGLERRRRKTRCLRLIEYVGRS